MKVIPCSACKGKGKIKVFDGLAVLAKKYPELPVVEMANRGWIHGAKSEGDETAEDEARWDASFLKFWEARSHAEVAELLRDGRLPFGAIVCSLPPARTEEKP